MRGKALGAYTIVMLIAGLCIGQAFFDNGPSEYRVIHDTETVTEYVTEYVTVPAEPAEVTVTDVPDECIDLAERSRDMANATEQFSTANSEVLDLISQARIAVNLGDMYALNDIETQLRDIRSASTRSLITIANEGYDFDAIFQTCKDKDKDND